MKSILFAMLAAGVSSQFCEEEGWEVMFRDDFNGNALNTSNWNIVTTQGDSRVRNACGTASNVQVSNGTLILSSKREKPEGCKFNYTTGAVTSIDKAFWQADDVRVCVRAVLPGKKGKGAGTWPAHWLLPNNNKCWPTNGEIDIMEMINGDGVLHGTYHWSPSKCGADSSCGSHTNVETYNTEMHEYATQYNTSFMSFQLDGKTYFRSKPNDPELFAVPYYALLQTALGGPWPGPVNKETEFPLYHVIDSIIVSKKK